MRKLSFIVILITVATLLSSCMKGEFSVLYTSLDKSMEVNDGRTEKLLKMNVSVSDEDASYTFILEGPDDMKWEGSLYGVGDTRSSDSLLVPSYEPFPTGEYKATIHSSKGRDVTVTSTLREGDTEVLSLEEAKTKGNVNVVYRDENGNETDEAAAKTVTYTYTDRYGTSVTVFQILGL